MWKRSDLDGDGSLTSDEFLIAMALVKRVQQGIALPPLPATQKKGPPPLPQKSRTQTQMATAAKLASAAVSVRSASFKESGKEEQQESPLLYPKLG